MKHHLVLIGFMGSGKSTLAQRLASLFSLPIFSTDCRIENLMQMKIVDIFHQYGEEFFRAKEKEIFFEIANLSVPHIIDCGGGFGAYQDVEILGEVVFLDLPFDVISQRVIQDAVCRPLFDDRAKELYDLRAKTYSAKANVILRSDWEIEEWIKRRA